MTAQPSGFSSIAWSHAQLIRIDEEWRKLQRAFACHSTIQVVPLGGEPPAEYQVQYRVRTLAFNASNVLEYISACPVHIWLPPQFPHAPPVVRPMASVFHPNVADGRLYIPGQWNPSVSLTQVITQIGRVLAYQTWDPEQNMNPVAMDWLADNQHLAPIDPAANFTPEAEGGPIARIEQNGTTRIEQLNAHLIRMRDRIGTASMPAPVEIERLASQTRSAASMFLAPDISQATRAHATTLDTLALSMLSAVPLCTLLAQHLAAARKVSQQQKVVLEKRAAVQQHLQEIEAAAPPTFIDDAQRALEQLPTPAALRPLVTNLRRALREAELDAQGFTRTITEQRSLSPFSRIEETPGTPLHDRLSAELKRVSDYEKEVDRAVETERSKIEQGLAQANAVLKTAERIHEWSEYSELLGRADVLMTKALELGPEGVQSYSMSYGSSEIAPIEFEQSLDASGIRLSVGLFGSSGLEMLDTRSGKIVARSDSSQLKTIIRGKSDSDKIPVEVKATETCEELCVQLDYLANQIKEKFERLAGLEPIDPVQSWLGTYEAGLRSTAAQELLTADQMRRRQELQGLLGDLVGVAKFKLRLSTYYQLERIGTLVPRIKAEIQRNQQLLEVAQKRLAEIAGKAGRDPETEKLIIPNKFAKEYSEQDFNRESAVRNLPKLKQLLANAAAQVTNRLSVGKLQGRPKLPLFAVFTAYPETWKALRRTLSDANLLTMLQQLERDLGHRICPSISLFAQPVGGATTPPPLPHASEPSDAQDSNEPAEAETETYTEEESAGEEAAEYVTEESADEESGAFVTDESDSEEDRTN